jgi:hypothetical protein
MKMIRYTILALALTLAAFTTRAQTTNSVPNFFQQSELWLTSFNTNYTFTGVSLEASTGYKQITGDNAANFVDAQYDFGGNQRLDLGLDLQFSGVGSAFNSEELQFGYALISHYDTKLQVDLGAGYDSNTHGIVVEPEIVLKKKLTPNTFAEIGVSLPEYFKGGINATPEFKTGVGFTF